jgi:NADH:ubiquinone oxidoreductase subunit 4 (subunit M)
MGSAPRDDVARQPIIASIMVLVLAGLTILLGLYPQLLLESVRATVKALALF